MAAALAAALLAPTAAADEGPSEKERATLASLDNAIDGAVVYTRRGHVRKVVIGRWQAVDLGPGDYARWAPDGKRLAVWHKGDVCVMNADGSGRRKLLSGADKDDGCPIEFHTNNREIVFWKKGKGFHAVEIETGKVRRLNAPGTYTGSACLSADGRRMACRWGNDLFAVDLEKGTHRKYARGCSPGLPPSGRLLMCNTGGHRELVIQGWDGTKGVRLNTRTASPDNRWDNHHWSNHEDFLAAEGEGKRGEVYVVQVSRNQCYRVSWEGRAEYPDLFVGPVAAGDVAAE